MFYLNKGDKMLYFGVSAATAAAAAQTKETNNRGAPL